MNMRELSELTGTVEGTELRLEGEDDIYMGWNFLLFLGGEKRVSVHVGGWYHGQIRNNQPLRVWGNHRPGKQLEAHKIEDCKTHGIFAADYRPPIFGKRSPIEGNAQEVFPINLPKGQTTRAVKGYTFYVMPKTGAPISVIMWGRKIEGQIVKGNKVQVWGRWDAGKVFHADTVEDLIVKVIIRNHPMGPPWGFLISGLASLGLAGAPWISLMYNWYTWWVPGPGFPIDPLPLLVMWSFLLGIVIPLVSGWLFFSRWRAGR